MRKPTPPADDLALALRTALDAGDTTGDTSEHPSEARLAAYLARELDEHTTDQLERHLAACARCTDDVVAAAAVEDEVQLQATRLDAAPASAAPVPEVAAARRVSARRPATYAPVKRRGRTLVRIAAGLTIVFAALVVAAGAGSRVVLTRLQPVMLDGMSDTLGRRVSSSSNSIVLAGGPGLRMNDVAIAEDPQFGTGSFATARSAALQLDPGALLRGQVRGAVHLDEPVVHLLRDSSGRWNVETLSGKGLAATAMNQGIALSRSGAKSEPGKERAVRLTTASVQDGVLEINDRSKGRDVTLRDVDVSYASADPHAPARISFEGTVGSDTQRIALRGEIGPFEGGSEPRYRFDEVRLQRVALADIPGAPADLTGDLTFDGKITSAGSGIDTVVMNASGDGTVGLCCGELRQRNLTSELLAALTQHTAGDAAASGADVLARARQNPALAAALSLDATPYQDISGAVAVADGSVTFQRLAVDTPLFQASAAGSLSRAGVIDAQGTVALTPAATAAIVALLPDAQRLFGAGAKLEVPFTVAGTWPDVDVKVDVRTAIARWLAPLDPRALVLGLRVAG